MSARFTPGPWSHVPWQVVEGEDEVRAPEGWLICSTSSGANARLIAAAPELYAACELAREMIVNEPFFDSDPALQDVLASVNAALAKATPLANAGVVS